MATFYNERICQIFEQLQKLRQEQGEEYRAKAYQRVIPILRAYPKEIESGEEVLHIPGIGSSLASKIDQKLRKSGTKPDIGRSKIYQKIFVPKVSGLE